MLRYAERGALVVIEPPDAGGIALPGGIAEYGETLEECAVREAAEETGLTARVDAELCRHLRRSGPFGPMLQVGFVGTVVGGELRDGDEGPARLVPAAEALLLVSPRRTGSAVVLAAYDTFDHR